MTGNCIRDGRAGWESGASEYANDDDEAIRVSCVLVDAPPIPLSEYTFEHADPALAVPWDDLTDVDPLQPRICGGVVADLGLVLAASVIEAALVLAAPGTTADELLAAVRRLGCDA